jgi:hypothetical protein
MKAAGCRRAVVGLTLAGTLCGVPAFAQMLTPEQEAEARRVLLVAIDRYIALHEQLDAVAPPLHASIPASQIAAHRQELSHLIARARAGARRGHVLNGTVERYLRFVIQTEYPDAEDRRQLRALVTEPQEEGPPVLRLRVNAPVPADVALAMTPPRLLARLPPLPEELEYRFVGRHFILRDTETELIVDYIYNLVP